MKEAKSPTKGIIKPDKRVLMLAQNLIGGKNIRVRPKFWKQTNHPRYINFIIYTGWQHWKKDYNWLYLPEQFNKVKEAVLNELLERKTDKNGKEDYKHKRIAYFCSRNRNDQMTFNFQNLRRLDLLKPTTCLFFGGKEWDPETDLEHVEYGKRPWKEEPRLYWFSNSDYADNEKLLVEARADLDLIWSRAGNYFNSSGYGEIYKAFIGHEHTGHTIGPAWMNDTNLKEGTSDFSRIIPDCAACSDCFDYCNDLRVKRAVQGGYKRTMTTQWQPKYGIVFSAPNVVKDVTFSKVEIDTGGNTIEVPTNLVIKPWLGNRIIGEKWFTSGLPCILYLVDIKHLEKCRDSSKSAIFYPDYDQTFWHELPKIYNEVPHLMNHSTAQFFFQKKLLFTANIRHLSVDRKITPESDNKPIFVLHYRINTASSVSGILYKFQSGDIFYRWELDTKGSLANQTILSSLAQAFTGRLMTQVGEWAGAAVKGAIGAAASYFGLGSLWKKFSGKKGADKEKAGGQGSVKDILQPEKYKEGAGVAKTSGLNQDKKTEQHSERKGKNTQKGKEWTLAPSLFATDTIDFNYDFWEFGNRTEKNPFMPRFEHSEVFYNNLINNNNLACAPIRSINTPFSQFKQLLTPGFLQGNITLDEDTDGFFAGLIRRGTPFIGEKKDFFKPFKYRYRGLSSYTAKSVSNAFLGQGEEEVEEVKKEVEEVIGKFDSKKAIAGYMTYFRVPDENLYRQLAIGQFSSHHNGPTSNYPGETGNKKFSDGTNMVCWGCGLDRTKAHHLPIKAGGEIFTYFDSSDLGEGHINIPEDCTLIIDPINDNIRVKMITVDYIYHYKSERQEAERDEDIAEQDYQETQHDPTNTSGEVEIEIEEDDEDEVDPDELEDEADGEEKEDEDEFDDEDDEDWDDEDEAESEDESEEEQEEEDEDESESESEDDQESDDEDDTDVEDDDDNDDEDEQE